MNWYNVSLIPNKYWDREMKRLARKLPKAKSKRSAKERKKVSWIKPYWKRKKSKRK